MAQKVEDYAKSLLFNQATCITTVETRHHVLLNAAMRMDLYLARGWCNKLCRMNITKYDGFRNKIHDYALSLLP